MHKDFILSIGPNDLFPYTRVEVFMKRKSRGQTLVEFALVFPLIMAFLFGSIDFGYYIYVWAESQFAARRGAEEATQFQPRVLDPSQYHNAGYIASDPCLRLVYRTTGRSGALSSASQIEPQDVFISFHSTAESNAALTGTGANRIGNIVQVRVSLEVPALTPLLEGIRGGEPLGFTAISRRTIVSNGPGFPMIDENGDDYNTCTSSN